MICNCEIDWPFSLTLSFFCGVGGGGVCFVFLPEKTIADAPTLTMTNKLLPGLFSLMDRHIPLRSKINSPLLV